MNCVLFSSPLTLSYALKKMMCSKVPTKVVVWWCGGGSGGGDFFSRLRGFFENVRPFIPSQRFFFLFFLSGDYLAHTNSTV